jgi:RNA polymerase sigma-70 factor, ECF subfamily
MRRTTGTDDSLIERAASGDQAAFAELTRRHRPWVVRALRAFVQSNDGAEDLAQEVFTQLFRSAGRYRGDGRFIAFLKAIALNVGRTHLRRGGRASLVSWDDVGEPLAEDLVEAVLGRALQADIRDAIARLPQDQRDALLLRHFAGLSIPEIAQRLGCVEGTVKSRLHHGLRKVRATLTKEETP